MSSCRARARRAGLACTVTVDWVVERIKQGCELTGLPFELSHESRIKQRSPYAPSIDRIDCTQGYTKENCRLVVWAMNALLGSWGEDVALRVAVAYVRRLLDSKRRCR